jgi:aminopeptidase N
MPGTNLTRDEARRRSELVTISAYDVDLDFRNRPAETETFRSVTTIEFTASEPGASTFLDLVAPWVSEVTLNGRSLDPATVFRDGRIQLDNLAAENTVRVVADCAYSNTGQGLHRTIDPADRRIYLYTHFEVPDARRLYANFEQPDLKASFRFTVVAPMDWEVFSNSPTPEPEDTDFGVRTWRFAPTPRISTYITAICAGQYHVERDQHTTTDGQVIPMAVACRASMAPYLDAAQTIDTIKRGFDFFIDKFGCGYPFAKYDQVFVPEYNIGAMENVGCVTVNENYLHRSKATDAEYQRRNETLLHELSHMWFGDLVTMKWWDDTWLKESFATYMSALATTRVTQWTDAWTTFAISDKAWALRQDQLPSTHPIVADISDLDDVAANFDGITYAKGASVLKQLVAYVGEEEFFAGVREYFAEHAWGNTTLDDLLAALEKASGRDLSAWSYDWLRTSGPNTLRPSVQGGTLTIHQESTPLRPHRIAVGQYALQDDRLVRTHRAELDVVGATTTVTLDGPGRTDLVLLNDDDLTYAKIRFDDVSLATLREVGIGAFAESLPRALCWLAAWDMTRTAELAARDYIDLALRSLPTETDIALVTSAHANLITALDFYVAPDARDQARDAISAFARQHLMWAPPGSDLQLSWTRLLAKVAASDDDLDLIAALRDGSTTIEGLTIDNNLRWMLLTTLARTGRIAESEIGAELTADQTTSGTEHAAAALASRPTPDAKAEAWELAVNQTDLANGVLEATIGHRRAFGGFAQPGQEELLEPYVDRYFGALAAVWESRPAEIASRITTALYPRLLASPDLIARTDAYLATAAPASVVQRILREGRDDVERAVRAQQLDAAGPDPVDLG